MFASRPERLLILLGTLLLPLGCAASGGSQLTPQGLSESRLERKIEAKAAEDSFPTAAEAGL